jgi:hypothetical protein
MIIVFAVLAVLGAGGIALAESRDRPRRRAERLAQAAQA